MGCIRNHLEMGWIVTTISSSYMLLVLTDHCYFATVSAVYSNEMSKDFGFLGDP